MASEYPFRRCLGVEIAPDLVEIARSNIRSYCNPDRCCADLSTIEGDAADFAFPERPSVVFLFNPFSHAVMARVAGNLERSYRCAPRPLILVHHHPRWFAPFSRLPFLVPIPLAEAPLDFFKVFASRALIEVGRERHVGATRDRR